MDMNKTLDAELKVLDDAELDAVTGGLFNAGNRSIVGLVNLGVGVGSVNTGGLNLGGNHVGIGGSTTGNFDFSRS